MNWRLIHIMLVAVVFCSSCKKDPEPFLSQGVITGNIYTYDSGSRASVTNTKVIAHGPYGSPSTLSDTNGDYTLSGLGNGTYEIEFDKEGYGKKFARGVQIFGKDTIKENKRLIKKADYQMPELSNVLYSNSYAYKYEVAFATNILGDNGKEMQIRVFISDNKDVSPTNYIYSEQAREVKRENITSLMIVCVNPQIVNSDSDHLFREGQTIYLIAYVCSIEEYDGEFSEYYGVPIFSTVDEQQHSRVIELKAP
jgi:hypothetical protein